MVEHRNINVSKLLVSPRQYRGSAGNEGRPERDVPANMDVNVSFGRCASTIRILPARGRTPLYYIVLSRAGSQLSSFLGLYGGCFLIFHLISGYRWGACNR